MWTVSYVPYPEQLYLEINALVYRDPESDN